MSYIVINLFAILLATGAGLIVGAGYRSMLHAPAGSPAALLVTAVLAEFWLASILAGALILAPQQADPWVMALGSAAIIWIGFILPALLVTHLFRGLTLGAALLDSGHWIVVMLVQAAVLHLVGLQRIG